MLFINVKPQVGYKQISHVYWYCTASHHLSMDCDGLVLPATLVFQLCTLLAILSSGNRLKYPCHSTVCYAHLWNLFYHIPFCQILLATLFSSAVTFNFLLSHMPSNSLTMFSYIVRAVQIWLLCQYAYFFWSYFWSFPLLLQYRIISSTHSFCHFSFCYFSLFPLLHWLHNSIHIATFWTLTVTSHIHAL